MVGVMPLDSYCYTVCRCSCLSVTLGQDMSHQLLNDVACPLIMGVWYAAKIRPYIKHHCRNFCMNVKRETIENSNIWCAIMTSGVESHDDTVLLAAGAEYPDTGGEQ